MTDVQEIITHLRRFRDEREWSQFHDSKNLAIALSIEAAELNELFLWKNGEVAEAVDKEKLKEELADIFSFAFLLADKHHLEVKEIILEKLRINEKKYPVDKSKGSAKKYNEL